jgi:hypothetical protein
MEDETEETNLNELFVQETLDPRIESVMPILSKLQKKVAEMKEVGELAEWADSLTEAPGAETLAHNVRTDDKNLRALDLEESEDDIYDPVVSAITRRIIRQHPELLKHGPDKVLAAIADVADFVGDVEEIGSSDVSGWVKQVARSLGNMDESMFEEELDEQRFPDNSNSTAKRDIVVTNLHDLIKDPRLAHEPNRHGPGNPKVKVAIRVMPSLTKEPAKKMAGNEVEEGSFGDMAKKVGSAVKSAGSKVLDKLGHGSDEELLKKLQKDVGAPAGSQHGKPSMAKPNDDSDILDEFDVDTLNQVASHAINTLGKPGAMAASAAGGAAIGATVGKGITKVADYLKKKKEQKALDKRNQQQVAEDEFAGDYATGEAGQWRNKGPKANKPATIGDLVGEGQEDLDAIRRLLKK